LILSQHSDVSAYLYAKKTDNLTVNFVLVMLLILPQQRMSCLKSVMSQTISCKQLLQFPKWFPELLCIFTIIYLSLSA